MNIKEAKDEIQRAITSYLMKDEFGEYRISRVRQRPILLIGDPGIGKTAIMEQIAQELGIGLVSYSMTHHTRQSAIGLPKIEKKIYDGKEYMVSEYTMSEIISSVYDFMEKTGLKGRNPLPGRNQLRVRNSGAGHAPVSPVQDFRKT